jgi:hypothetical protein
MNLKTVMFLQNKKRAFLECLFGFFCVALNLEPVGMMGLKIHVEQENSYQNV